MSGLKATGKPTHIKDLVPDPANRRKHNPRNLGMVVDALHQVGAARSIVIDEDNVVLAGNGVTEAAAEAGITKVQVVEADGNTLVAVRRIGLSAEQKRALAIYDNRTAELASWDAAQLQADLDAGLDLTPWFSEEELAGVLGQGVEPKGGLTDPDAVPEQRATDIKLGDLFELGKHRLLCGDSTKAEDVARLMRGASAEMMFTDPPYGVAYDGGHFHSGDVNIKRPRAAIKSDLNADIYSQFLPIALECVDGPCYLWFAGGKGQEVYTAVHAAGGEIHALLIWHKTNATYAAMNAQYKQRHEPFLYFKPRGSTLRWVGASNECTVWDIARDGVNEFHPTQKPVALGVRAIGNHNAATIYDGFAGSGSTLIAAEQMGRSAMAAEIEPSYCQVVIDRWEQFTGQKAVKVGEVVRA